MKKPMLTALAGALLVVTIVASHLWLRLGEERARSELLAARVAELESRAAGRTAAVEALPPAATSTTTATAELPVIATTATQPASAPAAAAQRPAAAAFIARALGTKEGRDMIANMARVLLPQQFPDLAKELNLTPEEADRFFETIARQQMSLANDSITVLRGGDTDPAARQELLGRLTVQQASNEAELAAMLGNRYPQWQEYQSSRTARQQVDRLRSTLGSGSTALSDTQANSLSTALAAEQARINEDNRAWQRTLASRNPPNVLEEQMQRTAANNKRLVEVASAHLDAQQLESYQRMLNQSQTLTRGVLGGLRALPQRPAGPPATMP